MGSSISSQVAEPAQNFAARPSRWMGGDRAHAQAGLFEQILSIPLNIRVARQTSPTDIEPAARETDSSADSTRAASESEQHDSENRRVDEEDVPAESNAADRMIYSTAQLSVPVAEVDVDISVQTEPDTQPDVLGEQAAPIATESSTIPLSQTVPSGADAGRRDSPQFVRQSSEIASATDEPTQQNAVAPITELTPEQPRQVERRVHRVGEKSPAPELVVEQATDLKQLPTSASVDTPSTEPLQTESREGEARGTSGSSLPQTVDDVQADESSRREKWFEKSFRETVTESQEFADQRSQDTKGEALAAAAREESAQSRKNLMNESVLLPQSDHAEIASAIDSGGLQAGLANSVAASTVASEVSRAVARAQTAGAAQSSSAVQGSTLDTPSRGTTEPSATQASSSNRQATNDRGEAVPESDQARQLTQQERVQLVQRVARSFSRLSADGGQISLRLHPPQLGSLNITIRIEGRSMSAKLQTETAAARDEIVDSLPILRQRLAEQGVDVQQFQVELAGQPADAGGFGQSSYQPESELARQTPNHRVDYRRLAQHGDSLQRLATGSADRILLATGSLDLKV